MMCTSPISLKRGRKSQLVGRFAPRVGVPPANISIPCQKCSNCRLTARARRTAQAVMEGLYTVEKKGIGHIWMATLSYRDAPVHRPVSRPRFVWLPQFSPRAGTSAAALHKDSDIARYQEDRMFTLYGMTYEEIDSYFQGTYDPIQTLQREDLVKYFKRIRKVVPGIRMFASGEYGDRTDRPHYHVLFFGPTREQFIQILGMWKLGFTDPGTEMSRTRPGLRVPTYTGMGRLDQQLEWNARPGAVAKYVAKYLAKMDRRTFTAATFAREHEFIQSRANPGLGYCWAERHLVPRLDQVYRKALVSPNFRKLAGPKRAVLAGYLAYRESRAVKLQGWYFPVGDTLSHHLMTHVVRSELLREMIKDESVMVQQLRQQAYENDPEFAAQVEDTLREAQEKSTLREERYLAQQAKREEEWRSKEKKAA